ncbi:hypothetical protein SLI_5946 [Streptomyces lividans 1326]|uniref:Uncharacterized protein n=1 Tax=Streptomyces lividans 1326 TaxID=1200984 RepID=A0A7U9HDD3_STRLI|nr:hypothetical protein SLI_5946 [Streptomyces lividans 1326]
MRQPFVPSWHTKTPDGGRRLRCREGTELSSCRSASMLQRG